MPLSKAGLPAIIVFDSAGAAEGRIAGVPAVARVVREVAMAGVAECWVEAGAGWRPGREVCAEIERLRGRMAVHLPQGEPAPVSGRVLVVAGEALPTARQLVRGGDGVMAGDAGGRYACARLLRPVGDIGRRYARSGQAILEATGKAGDGIVSHHLNRPVSRAISSALLRMPGFRPIHATIGTAILAVLMFVGLMVSGQAGLVTGACLFQAASVFDGVDGEAARATFRCSDEGAMLDSLVDAGTNLAFVLGLAIHFAVAGQDAVAGFAVLGLLMLATGLVVIGRRARVAGGPFGFDGVKERVRGTRAGQWLVYLTMRDFWALAAVGLALAGLAAPALEVFCAVMAAWLIVVLAMGVRLRVTAG